MRNEDAMAIAPTMTDSPTPSRSQDIPCIYVCQHRSCELRGSPKTLEAFQAAKPKGVVVQGCGCLGQCSSGPSVRVTQDDTWYWQVQPEDVPRIIEQHLKQGEPVQEKLNTRVHLQFYF
ncbi:(2Fe-2S) ferredoxin domain-containing protein [Phormidium yuhuli AB48]|uniref:(2Fe-2S) ferredoxin domain-containing protein n=1 Tax=Phormidium yuhuli AB48 TaxID=2940671 RepID=A0ABY5AR66_9CYAN|nr:(2Fe-2S) ferredoxin domain-containing protein [Phormidium yuhuli]USR90729.1 (2Fe-2S) ferredoxin domain-containing protein [Phormidium yuhuli AB48]